MLVKVVLLELWDYSQRSLSNSATGIRTILSSFTALSFLFEIQFRLVFWLTDIDHAAWAIVTANFLLAFSGGVLPSWLSDGNPSFMLERPITVR